MSNTRSTILACIFGTVILLATGCTKPGMGGTASITGQVKHHDDIIPNADVYIKYGAEEQPGALSEYDAQTIADGGGTYIFEDLKKGKYYLYAIGFDPAFSEDVIGGIPLKINTKGEIHTESITHTERHKHTERQTH